MNIMICVNTVIIKYIHNEDREIYYINNNTINIINNNRNNNNIDINNNRILIYIFINK